MLAVNPELDVLPDCSAAALQGDGGLHQPLFALLGSVDGSAAGIGRRQRDAASATGRHPFE
ncbi:hypothetical protein [Micromonospora sp. NPDC005197]|uniref:hypothetical protein n=1 Tax=Micromonospora sp. NPDC005197 TaxID=3157020 RepID=UPI0033BA1ED6